MRKPGIVFIFLIILTASCFYTETDRYPTDIISEYNPKITFSSNIDTIKDITVTDSLLFSYKVAIDTGSLYFSDVYLGNLHLVRSDTTSDSLWIYPGYVNNNGDYELTLVSYFKSYSESLADIMNAEFLAADTSWSINIIREEVK